MPTNLSTTQVGTDETPVEVSEGGHAYTAQSFLKIIPCVRTPMTAGSGGTQLENVPCGSVILRNGSGNNIMFIGGVGNNAPFSGRGLSFYGNETITLPVTNMNAVSVMATVSGEFIECLGFLDGHETPINVSGIYIAPDETSPTILSGAFSVSPTSGISGVATNTEIWVIFSECMNPSTVTDTSFVVRVSGSSVNISGVVSDDNTDCAKFHFNPYSGLITTSTMYRATLGTSITDMAGNPLLTSGVWHWTTEAAPPPPDTTLPNVSGTSPTSGTLNFGVADVPIITFSEALQSGSVNDMSIGILLSGIALGVDPELMSDLKTVHVHHDLGIAHELNPNTAYYLTIFSGGVMDLAGNRFSGTLTIPFFTEDSNDLAYNVATAGIENNLDNDKFRIGMRVRPLGSNPNYIGEQFVKVRVNLRKTGNPMSGGASGLVVQLRKNSDNSVVHFTRPFTAFLNPATDLTTTVTAYDFYNTDNFYMAADNDKIEVQWLSGTTTDAVRVSNVNTNANAGMAFFERTGATYSGSNNFEFSGKDIAGMVWVR